MVYCDSCDTWYHWGCIDSPDQAKALPVEVVYTCTACSREDVPMDQHQDLPAEQSEEAQDAPMDQHQDLQSEQSEEAQDAPVEQSEEAQGPAPAPEPTRKRRKGNNHVNDRERERERVEEKKSLTKRVMESIIERWRKSELDLEPSEIPEGEFAISCIYCHHKEEALVKWSGFTQPSWEPISNLNYTIWARYKQLSLGEYLYIRQYYPIL
jgi:hypothetical protein